MKKNMKALLAGILVLSLGMTGITSCERKGDSQPSVPTEENSLITRVEFLGLDTLEVNQGQSVNAKEGVTVAAYYVVDGVEQMIKLTAYVKVTQNGQNIATTLNTQEVGEFEVVYTLATENIVAFDFADGLELTAKRTLKVNKVEVASVELIQNGDFANGWDAWDQYSEGTFEITFEDGVMKCVESVVPNNSYGIRLNTKSDSGFTLNYGVTYHFEIRMKADTNRKVKIQFGTILPSSPYWVSVADTDGNANLDKVFEVTTEWQLFTWDFTVASETNDNVHMTLEMGTVDGDSTATTIYADDASLKAVVDDGVDRIAPSIKGDANLRINTTTEAGTINPLEGITVTDNVDENITPVVESITDAAGNVVESIPSNVAGEYSVVIKATDAAGNEKRLTRTIKVVAEAPLGLEVGQVNGIVWGDEAGMVGAGNVNKFVYWNVLDASWGCGAVTTNEATLEDGVATFNLGGLAGNDNIWSEQLFYISDEVGAGTYRVSLNVNSSIARKVEIYNTPYDLVEGDNLITIDRTLDAAGRVNFAMLMGGGYLTDADSCVIKVSNFSIKYIGSNLVSANAVVGGGEQDITVNNQWYYWNCADASWGIGGAIAAEFSMNEAGNALTIATTGLAGNENFWSSQLFLKTEETDAGTYVLTMKVNSSIARKIRVNGVDVDLVAGDNDVKVEITNAQYGQITLAIMLGGGELVEAGTDASTFVISDYSLLFKA